MKTARFLPTSRSEMGELGWDSCDIVLVTGDAYVDHPSFGVALIGRLLEAAGFRVGIIPQPDWRGVADFQALGRPKLFFGVTSGNMDSMVNRYTSEGRLRSDDAYSPDGRGGMRPDRAVIVYSQRLREAFKDAPIVIGGIEASLRRLSHYDYWSDKVRRSILLDSRASVLLFGNAEKAITEIARRVAAGEPLDSIRDVRGCAWVRDPIDEASGPETESVRLPSHEEVSREPEALAEATRSTYLETNPFNARPLVQRHGDKDVFVSAPPMPASTEELDRIFELPYARAPHPRYERARIPAWEMIRFSVCINRGCFGGCSFCAISLHEGRVVQSRSKSSVLREIGRVASETQGFTGVVSDLGGPTANMYRQGCEDSERRAGCRRLSCLHPRICSSLDTSHSHLLELYREVRSHPRVKKVLVASGVRHDLALCSPEYVEELVTHHVGGLLKVAPEHSAPGPLSAMRKPPIERLERFERMFRDVCDRAGKKQHIVPYFIAGHPGTTDEDMVRLALWLKARGLQVDQVQTFLPTPGTLSTAMYHSGKDPLAPRSSGSATVPVPRGARQRRLQKALLRCHDPAEWRLVREALLRMGREDLIEVLRPAERPSRLGARGGPKKRRKRPGGRGG